MTDVTPSCATCDFMRYEGETMRCYWNPPEPAVIGQVPNRIQGAPPMLVITGILPEVSANRFCRHHPMLRADGEVVASPGVAAEPQKVGGIIIDGNETRQ